jgi:hypothetical protein
MEEIKLTDTQQQIFRQCLNAVVNGPFFPDWEFHTLFGVDRNEIDEILNKWPNVNYKDNTIKIAINNTLNNLCGYPISSEEQERWTEFISISRVELSVMHDEWLQNTKFHNPE